MYQRDHISSLHQAYNGYFDDMSLPSTTAIPLGAVTSTVPQEALVSASTTTPAPAPAPASLTAKVHRRPSMCYLNTAVDDEDTYRREYIQLTQLQFALLCMGVGVAIGLIVSHRLRV